MTITTKQTIKPYKVRYHLEILVYGRNADEAADNADDAIFNLVALPEEVEMPAEWTKFVNVYDWKLIGRPHQEKDASSFVTSVTE